MGDDPIHHPGFDYIYCVRRDLLAGTERPDQLLDSAPRSSFASLGWLLLSFLFSIYINNFGNFSATYGSIGGIILLLLWLYLSAMLLIIGGQINAVMQGRRHSRKRLHRKKTALPGK